MKRRLREWYLCCTSICHYNIKMCKCSLSIFSSSNLSLEHVPWWWKCGDICRFEQLYIYIWSAVVLSYHFCVLPWQGLNLVETLVTEQPYLGEHYSLRWRNADSGGIRLWRMTCERLCSCHMYGYIHICIFAIDRLSIIWKSDLTDKMKRSFFQAVVVSILLYGCTTCTLTKRLKKKLDSNYTRMLRAILNKSWRQHPTSHQLYGHLPPITKTIQVRWTRHAGHCWRSKDELISDVLLWTPAYG